MVFEESKFRDYLLYDLLVRRGTEVYYLYWVKEFFKKGYMLQKENWHQCLTLFLQEIMQHDVYQDWQGKQAEKAIKLYFTGFLKDKSVDSSIWDKAEAVHVLRNTDGSVVLLNRFREELQKRNCGQKAERVYLNWVELFLVYVEKNTGSKPTKNSNLTVYVRRFFTYLDVNRDFSRVARNTAFGSLVIFFKLVFQVDISEMKHHLRLAVGE